MKCKEQWRQPRNWSPALTGKDFFISFLLFLYSFISLTSFCDFLLFYHNIEMLDFRKDISFQSWLWLISTWHGDIEFAKKYWLIDKFEWCVFSTFFLFLTSYFPIPAIHMEYCQTNPISSFLFPIYVPAYFCNSQRVIYQIDGSTNNIVDLLWGTSA